jgi:hypothetical protein
MSYQEKNVTVSLVTHLLIVGYFLFNLYQMVQAGGLIANRVFVLWAVVIIATILANIIGSILTNILLAILHAIRTRGETEERFIEDERDQLIGLKGMKVSYIAFSLGTLAAMLTFVFGHPPLVMFSILVFASIAAQIIGDVSQLYLYRKGF